MSYRQTKNSSLSSTKGFRLGLQPAPAWMAILGLILFLALGFLAHVGRLLILPFPVGSVAVGVFLYRRYPIFYVSFTWWIWFLGALVRRIIDYQSGHLTAGPWILTPLLVTSISFATLVRHLPKSHKEGSLPLILCVGTVFYGFLIGLIQNEVSLTIIMDFLSWLTPILFCFHLFVNWRDYPSYRQNIQRTFLWGVLVMGVYGIVQYVVAPDWDRFWLIESKAISFGTPEPFGIRVSSSVNSPQDFAAIMMAGLLLLFANQGVWRFPSAAAGYLSFLLSLARSAWLSWSAGLLMFITSVNARLQMRLIVSIMVAAVFVVPLVNVEPFSTIIHDRVESLFSVKNDFSYQERVRGYNAFVGQAIAEFIGKGMRPRIGSVNSFVIGDNGLLLTLLTFGWFGTIPYFLGLVLLLFKLFQNSELRFDPIASVSRAISLGILAQISLTTIFTGGMGMVLWGFLGIALAAQKYYSYQKAERIKGI